MTRLSDALRRAQETAGAQPFATEEALPPSTTWKFAPVETMHVPDEPPAAAAVVTATEPVPEREFEIEVPVAAPPPPVSRMIKTPARQPNRLHMGDADRSKLIVGEDVDPAMVEQYRHLAAVLHHAQKASGVRSVMVTSALPAEGKTLTATNLALTLSESYQRRVLRIITLRTPDAFCA